MADTGDTIDMSDVLEKLKKGLADANIDPKGADSPDAPTPTTTTTAAPDGDSSSSIPSKPATDTNGVPWYKSPDFWTKLSIAAASPALGAAMGAATGAGPLAGAAVGSASGTDSLNKIAAQQAQERAEKAKMAHDLTLEQAKGNVELKGIEARTKMEQGLHAVQRLQDYQKSATGDEIIKKPQEMLSQGKDTLAAIDDAEKNPQSRAEIPLMLARFTSAGQRMNQTEIEQGLAKGTFGDRLQQMYRDAKSNTWSPTYADYARQFVITQMQSEAQNLSDAQLRHAKMYSNASGLPVDVAHQQLFSTAPGTLASVPVLASKGGAQKDNVGATAAAAAPHPQDAAALVWAKSNPGDPRAKRILQLNGL